MSRFTASDHAHMARALQLAERGAFTTKPNPMVGCVIADGARVLGEGWHVRAGEPHAEVHALAAAGAAARGATAYVTLEPCAHHGRTPPCADALVAAGISLDSFSRAAVVSRLDGCRPAALCPADLWSGSSRALVGAEAAAPEAVRLTGQHWHRPERRRTAHQAALRADDRRGRAGEPRPPPRHRRHPITPVAAASRRADAVRRAGCDRRRPAITCQP
jgi:hypothetical protein